MGDGSRALLMLRGDGHELRSIEVEETFLQAVDALSSSKERGWPLLTRWRGEQFAINPVWVEEVRPVG